MNRSQTTGRSPLVSSPAIPAPLACWAARPIGAGALACRRIFGLSLLGLVALASGCSTMTVKLKGIGSPGMNPASSAAKGAPLEVFAFFLKSREEFEKKSHQLKDFLTPELRENLEVPKFLKPHTVAVKQLLVQPGDKDPVAVSFDVPKEAKFVGLVASFQDHDDEDSTEKWNLVLPTLPADGWVLSFYVNGKRLEEKPSDVVDKPAASPQSPEKAK